jgi:glutamate synthase (NADPH/NADH) large chain/glutamate synthase (ferredoxin)
VQDHGLEQGAGQQADREARRAAIDKGEKVQFMEVARNVNRSVGAMLSGEVTAVHPRACRTTPSASS